jgi:general secretion pathway protein M
MTSLPEGVFGKGLALALSLGVFTILYYLVVAPILGLYHDAQHSLRERTDMVQRLDNSSRDLPRLRDLVEQGQGANTILLLNDASDTDAAASIQSTVKKLIETNGGALTNSEILGAEQPDDRYRRIRVRVSFAGDLPLLTSVLRSIDVAKPALFVDNIDVRAAAGGDKSKDRGHELSIAFDVYAFRSP